ncbi:hypothetical protein [Hymenobacter baengnokdamensis]|uniref:hypothetical protein n=1 Tax=Hymenobacter baengnokdamensis TaxID=2615203 RepID=UPI0012452FF8|nr:hypothetical protein [Hymenobacter baengnokdamensis]
MLVTLIWFSPLILLLLALLVQHLSPPLYARTFGRVLARVGAVKARALARLASLHSQLVAYYQAADGYLKFATSALLVAVGIFLVLPPVLRLFYPTAGGFDQGTINTLALAALQYFAAAQLALFTYKRLLPGFYAYLVDTLQDKVLENVTGELEAQLLHPETLDTGLLPVLIEHRKLLELKFTIRCKRLYFCFLPLAFFFIGAQLALTTVLTVVPH